MPVSTTASARPGFEKVRDALNVVSSVDLMEAVRGALGHKNDPLRCAHDLFAALQTLKAEEFRSLGAETPRLVSLAKQCEKLPWDLRKALVIAAVNRWLELDATAATKWLNSSDEILAGKENRPLRKWVVEAFARPGGDDTIEGRQVFESATNNLNFRMRAELPAQHVTELLSSIYENEPHDIARVV